MGFREGVERCIADVDRPSIKGRRRSVCDMPRDKEEEDLLVKDLVRHVRKDDREGSCVSSLDVVKEVEDFVVRGVIESESRRDG